MLNNKIENRELKPIYYYILQVDVTFVSLRQKEMFRL